ncbi:hypothetical protein BOTBODRAFT_43497 [Botryobasidium botryosum FD-172 SS1]|uniref:Uncharacterized protein n=1 Tax=Botryobasidium botryosum (strain FD-172 SS1) TaxID=930990 RepID=A0A067MXA5_BOTB1|nr:hypothetical protein BOTBODRAFT_43497 [Botryobasidium botryosum FD-172 SS1]
MASPSPLPEIRDIEPLTPAESSSSSILSPSPPPSRPATPDPASTAQRLAFWFPKPDPFNPLLSISELRLRAGLVTPPSVTRTRSGTSATLPIGTGTGTDPSSPSKRRPIRYTDADIELMSAASATPLVLATPVEVPHADHEEQPKSPSIAHTVPEHPAHTHSRLAEIKRRRADRRRTAPSAHLAYSADLNALLPLHRPPTSEDLASYHDSPDESSPERTAAISSPKSSSVVDLLDDVIHEQEQKSKNQRFSLMPRRSASQRTPSASHQKSASRIHVAYPLTPPKTPTFIVPAQYQLQADLPSPEFHDDAKSRPAPPPLPFSSKHASYTSTGTGLSTRPPSSPNSVITATSASSSWYRFESTLSMSSSTSLSDPPSPPLHPLPRASTSTSKTSGTSRASECSSSKRPSTSPGISQAAQKSRISLLPPSRFKSSTKNSASKEKEKEKEKPLLAADVLRASEVELLSRDGVAIRFGDVLREDGLERVIILTQQSKDYFHALVQETPSYLTLRRAGIKLILVGPAEISFSPLVGYEIIHQLTLLLLFG